ncbi:sensor histidine kinase [Acrocarpospora pleiomorpha]|nr:histidine kinase [Acrocarpospora pleiomorpha]
MFRATLATIRAHPARVDLVMAVLFSLAATWFALRTGPNSTFSSTPQVDTDPFRPRPEILAEEGAAADPLRIAALSLLVTLPLAWRRRWPLAVFAIQFAGVLAVGSGSGAAASFVAVLIGAYSLAVYGRRPVLSVGALLVTCVFVAVTFAEVTPPIPGWASSFAILLPIALFGLTIRAARSRADAWAQRAEALRDSQEAAARAAVAQERARIARELHDVISHHVSVMVIQAGAAEKVIGTRPDLTRSSLTAIAASGREAMGELRHLLGVLAAPAEDRDDPLRPQPGLEQLDALVDKVRAAGQPVTIRRTRADLTRSADMAAYRVVQEALTNALRHAPGAATTVVVELDGPTLVVEVSDEGAPGSVVVPAGAGSGLLGLAERLAIYGGTLKTGPRLGGGFKVSARIPAQSS